MPNYDFSTLNDKEFEALTMDLLSKEFECRIERFKPGRDAGVDGRFFSISGKETIIQCKHWLKSGLAALLRSIENTEAEKVHKLVPERYIFVTSLSLSRANKLKIKSMFAPHILIDSDVIGNEDLNSFLSDYPEIEKRHYKLWLSSTNVLQTILNSGILGRSKNRMEDIIQNSTKYVETHSHGLALEKLETMHSVIIKGSPGVGKTTLAEQLCLHYAASDFEFIVIENSLNEAEEAYSEACQQIFYFDDFLGSNYILALEGHQDSHVINFMKRIEKDKKKRFILTTRSNIYNQGKKLSELFDQNKIDKNEYELSVDNLKIIDKARILYNHLWFSDLEEEYINELYEGKKYRNVIQHTNFNPRLISFITDPHRLKTVHHTDYWSHISSILENPKDIWRHVFENQIDAMSKHIVIGLVIQGGKFTEDELEVFYRNITGSGIYKSGEPSTYETAVRLLVGALLNRNVYESLELDSVKPTKNITYSLFNPSITDFVLANYMLDFVYIDDIIFYVSSLKALRNLRSLHASNQIDSDQYYKHLESQLLRLASDKSKDLLDLYKITLINLLVRREVVNKAALEYISILARGAVVGNHSSLGIQYFDFILWAISKNLISKTDDNLPALLEHWVKEYGKDPEECITIAKIMLEIKLANAELEICLKDQYVDIYSVDLAVDVLQEDKLKNVNSMEDYENFGCSELIEYVENIVSDFPIQLPPEDVDHIVESTDIDYIISHNVERNEEYDTDYGGSYRASSYKSPVSYVPLDAVDDLFDRG